VAFDHELLDGHGGMLGKKAGHQQLPSLLILLPTLL
jgi:hypothetical protein